jgi:hypothetical protein
LIQKDYLARLAGFEPTTPWFVAGSNSKNANEINDLAAPTQNQVLRSAQERF